MSDQFSEKIIEKINVDKITSLPRWRFLLMRTTFWIFAVFSVIVGSIAFGEIIFLVSDQNTHGFFEVSHDAKELLLMVPFLWLAALVLFTIITKVAIKHTKNGYKYSLKLIISSSIILSFLFGSLLNYEKTGEATHESLNKNSLYNLSTYDSRDAWSRPVIGRLSGVVVTVKDEEDFSLTDFRGHAWQVHVDVPTDPIHTHFIPKQNFQVRMLGAVGSDGIFIAHKIHAWEDD